MTPARRPALFAAAGIGALVSLMPSAAAEIELEPDELLRSLQRVQDQIAEGDKEALEMQRELVRLIDEGFRELEPEAFSDPENARSLLAFALAGGNPTTLEALLPYVGNRADKLARMGVAILVYQKGAAKAAAQRLAEFDPLAEGGLFGASIALVRGMVAPNARASIADLDTARLMAPGTLIEEAALRRLLLVHAHLEDPEAFLRVASRYARHFIESPYALQFVQQFIAGVTAMDPRTDREGVMEILDFMPDRYRRAVFTRLIRNATLEGRSDLVAFLSAQETEQPEETLPDEEEIAPREEDPSEFYSLVSGITSENVQEIAAELSAVDPATLSAADRKLLQAVLAVAGSVTEPPMDVADPVPATDDREMVSADPVPDRLSPAREETATRESMVSEPAGEQLAEGDRGNMEGPAAEMEQIDTFISDARKMLDDADKVLESAR